MKLLSGLEMSGFIKERQARQVRGLRQQWGIAPKLAIIVTVDNPAIETYMKMKSKYGADILVDVDIHRVKQADAPDLIHQLNVDVGVHGIIVQLPLEDWAETDAVCDLVAPEKDVDALGQRAIYDPATPMAILWLLAGYNIDLAGKHIVLVGRGKLVGQPLEKMLHANGLDIDVLDITTSDNETRIAAADVLISATGVPHLIKPDMLKPGVVVIDAGVAGEGGKTVGDLDPSVYSRPDITVTPEKGGVGPLTICALFDNLIRAARPASEPNE